MYSDTTAVHGHGCVLVHGQSSGKRMGVNVLLSGNGRDVHDRICESWPDISGPATLEPSPKIAVVKQMGSLLEAGKGSILKPVFA